jgi:hypothetical protein
MARRGSGRAKCQSRQRSTTSLKVSPSQIKHCHPERSEGPAFASVFVVALLVVIPEGNLLSPT